MPRIFACCLLAALLLAAALAQGQDAPDPASVPDANPSEGIAASADDIARWIRDLDADQFVVRETAMQNLILAGQAAIHPLVEAVAAERWELNTRCVHILQQIALSGEPQTEDEARLALETLATRPVRSAALRARETLAGIDNVRQQRALQELIRLGAKTLPEDRPQLIAFVTGLEFDDHWRGSERDLRQLRWLKDLDHIALSGPGITDRWFEHVLALPNLYRLTLNRTATTDASLTELHRLKQLRVLELKYVPVTDASVSHLARLTEASEMKLYGTDMTPEGAARLEAELRKTARLVKIDYRRGAFLGIGGDFHTLGCSVLEVRDDTAAARAGILEGDVIVAYGGQRVENFEALTQLIAQHRPGDKVTIEFVRQAELLSVNRVLTEKPPLGIQGKPHVLGCEVAEVEEKSLAALIGVRKGDVVYRYNGQTVKDPEQLQGLFAESKQGDTAMFEFTRHVDLRRAEVKLGEWE